MSAAQFALLEALTRDLARGDALEAALNADRNFDLGCALRHFVALGALAGARLQRHSGKRDRRHEKALTDEPANAIG